jgi:hypothetical protein
MGKQKSLDVIISCIEDLMTQGGLESEQTDALVTALRTLNRHRRRTPSSADVYRIVRVVAEKVSRAFISKQ